MEISIRKCGTCGYEYLFIDDQQCPHGCHDPNNPRYRTAAPEHIEKAEQIETIPDDVIREYIKEHEAEC